MSTPWAAMLRLAASRFRITPAAFWRLSLTEWRALSADLAPSALDRPGLDALTDRFPDDPR